MPFRYVWPAELDLMARLACMTVRERWAGWDRRPFTSEGPPPQLGNAWSHPAPGSWLSGLNNGPSRDSRRPAGDGTVGAALVPVGPTARFRPNGMMPFGSLSGFLTATQRVASPSAGSRGDHLATHEEGLRRLVLHDEGCIQSMLGIHSSHNAPGLDPATQALVRLGWAWWPMGAAPFSPNWAAEAALDGGPTAEDVVGTLIAVAPISGLARVISATSEVALAIGYALDQAFEGLSGGLVPMPVVRWVWPVKAWLTGR